MQQKLEGDKPSGYGLEEGTCVRLPSNAEAVYNAVIGPLFDDLLRFTQNEMGDIARKKTTDAAKRLKKNGSAWIGRK